MIEMYKVALIGYGRWGKVLLPYLEKYLKVRRIFSRSVEKKSRFTNNLGEIFSPDVNAVVIATPIETHFDIVLKALNRNKHVFCEKPLALSSYQAEHLAYIANQKGLCLVTDYTYTFSEKLQRMCDQIGGKGQLREIDLSLRRNLDYDNPDVYWILASHMLAVLDMFTDPKRLEFWKINSPSGTGGAIRFRGEIEGSILVDLQSKEKETKIVFYTNGEIRVLDNLAEDDNLDNAIKFFIATLEGKEDGRANLKTSLAVTDILWGLEKNKETRTIQ